MPSHRPLAFLSISLFSLCVSAAAQDTPGLVSVDFNQESITYEGQGVLGGTGDTFWNGEVPGFAFPWYMSNWFEADGVTGSDIRLGLSVSSRSRQLPRNALFRDWCGKNTKIFPGPGEIRFTGLQPNTEYDICFYADGSSVEGDLGALVRLAGEAKSTTGGGNGEFVEGVNYVLFRRVVSNGFGEIVGEVDDSPVDESTGEYAINGFQIVPSSAKQCLADANGDGTLDPSDFSAWIDAYNNGQPACDQNGDGQCSPNDFTAWVDNYNLGC